MEITKQKHADTVINSRLLVLQSKRLLLNSAQHRLDERGLEAHRERVDRLHREAADADVAYRATILLHGSPEQREYWLVAYGRLIEIGQALAGRLRASVDGMPAADRFEVSTDVEMLEDIVDRWTDAMRATMADAVA
jgi:hypothetical protein